MSAESIRDRQMRERLELKASVPASDAMERRRERWRAKAAAIAQEVRDSEYFIRCLRECLGLAPYAYQPSPVERRCRT